MIATRLKITNLRAIEAAEFCFQPGLNLIVGVNGVGKTTVLDALAVCFSAVTKQANKLRGRAQSFAREDILVGAEALTAQCDVQLGERDYSYVLHRPRESSAPQEQKVGMPREQVYDTPERAEFLSEVPSCTSGTDPDCMGRIHNGPATMKIEHWQCQRRHSAEQLNYRNLLGACLGGDGQPRHLQHCDTSKGDHDLQ